MDLKSITPYKFWCMIHDCSPSCNCIKIPEENKAVIKLANKSFEGCGSTKEESIEIALYKLFYNHFKITSSNWNHYRETNLKFGDPMPDHLVEITKRRIEGMNSKLR